MITTENVIHQKTGQLSDRARVRAFLARKDVIAQMQAHGISPAEALSRTESMTDSEIASIADEMNKLPSGAYALDGGILAIIGMALYAIVAAIVIYFSASDEKEEKQE